MSNKPEKNKDLVPLLYKFIFVIALSILTLEILYFFVFQVTPLNYSTLTGLVLLAYSYKNIFLKN
ncbi:hypothetical protein [Enterococcus sp. HY326]|uniref:hypothetical protein n=1 Tax=Enterococcus sp. HY326 TaxID=2971265 RepID=UPI00223F7D68|nr:hypothetical protein [Enterococcus sp. HY326]